MKTYKIVPVSKPRMTQRDRWAKRPSVLRYRAFADEVRMKIKCIPIPYHVVFVIPMPKSWSKKRKVEMDGKPHEQKPDKDNLEKALLDALYGDDSHAWDGRTTKIWGREGQIIVSEIEPFQLAEAA